jgi:hypothetical protein
MPVKKLSEHLQTTSQMQLENPQQNGHPTKVIFGLIITILVLFVVNVGYETITDVQNKFVITENESKSCMIDFQTKKCDTLNLTADCSKILDCVQK